LDARNAIPDRPACVSRWRRDERAALKLRRCCTTLSEALRVAYLSRGRCCCVRKASHSVLCMYGWLDGARAHGMRRGACWAQRIDEARQRYRFCLDEVSHRGSKTGPDGRCAVGVDAGGCWLEPPSSQSARGRCLRLYQPAAPLRAWHTARH
jgi:hypothetical protein